MLRRIRKSIRRGEALSEPARRKLVGALYSEPSIVVLGALAGIGSSAIAAWASGLSALWAMCVLLTAISLCRLGMILALTPQLRRVRVGTLELLFAVGAYAYALALGITASLTIVLQAAVSMQALVLVNAVAYAIAVASRNASRPSIAIGQLLLATLPIFAAGLWTRLPHNVFLSFSLVLLIAGMSANVGNIFRMLRDSLNAAEVSTRLAESMRTLARTDVVTGLANRAGLNHDLAEALKARSEDQSLALFWLDLDRFKEVNDLLGHTVGDRVLAEVGKRLRAVAPDGATVARFGGDEFILLCDIADRRACEQFAGRLLDSVTRPLRIDDKRLEVPASMGISILPEDGRDIDTLMQHADLALYHAKIGGKNQSRFFDKSMSRDLIRRREIEAELRAAIQRDELSIFFQPIVDLESGRIRTFEALVRWFHPQKGELKPDEFIPVAEETGVIVTLGNWITAQAARAAIHWPDDVTIAVNLSPLQIKAPGAALGILSALREAGLSPSRLELEVTESLFLDDNHASANFIRELSEAGVRFALDDFGTGYSSLGYINTFPFTKIKVDRSFVSGPNVGRKSHAIIRAVAEMGAQLDMDIVAEGIETLEQLQTVRAAGCSLGQGYYFSRAVPDYLAAMLLAQEREEGATRAVG